MAIQDVLQSLLIDCCQQRAQDLYFRPTVDGWQLAERRATGLVKRAPVDKVVGEKLINRLKYLAGMDISENRRPQTGRTEITVDQEVVYLRLATIGDFLNRESLVVRFIYPLLTTYRCVQASQLQQLEKAVQQSGLILFAGPTGSGKTTSLYYLAEKVMAERMVVTIEDPIEIKQPEFLQLQVNPEAGLSYETLLKISLRLRPDILIIGEIRDLSTAQHAVTAALSGHLVLSTIHARDAQGVVQRLLNLGVEYTQLAACLTSVAYQSLQFNQQHQLAAQYEILTANDLGISNEN